MFDRYTGMFCGVFIIGSIIFAIIAMILESYFSISLPAAASIGVLAAAVAVPAGKYATNVGQPMSSKTGWAYAITWVLLEIMITLGLMFLAVLYSNAEFNQIYLGFSELSKFASDNSSYNSSYNLGAVVIGVVVIGVVAFLVLHIAIVRFLLWGQLRGNLKRIAKAAEKTA